MIDADNVRLLLIGFFLFIIIMKLEQNFYMVDIYEEKKLKSLVLSF